MKRMIVIIAVLAAGWIFSVSANASGAEQPCVEAKETILRLLAHPVQQAITDYYGESRQYWNDEILAIKMVPRTPYYEVVVRVETFYGPHNPPYGIETISFYVSYGSVELKTFQHEDEPE